MPVTHVGETTKAFRTDEAESFVATEFGLAEYRLEWSCIKPRLPWVLTNQLTYGSPHPDFPGLLLKERKGTVEPGQIVKINTLYTGPLFGDQEPLPDPTFSTRAATSGEPLETHSRYEDVSRADLRKIKNHLLSLSDDDPPGVSELALELYEKMLKGQQSYLRPGVVHSIQYVSRSRPGQSDMAELGKIASNPRGAPPLPSGQNYLSVGINWQRDGDIYTIVKDYQSSGDNGWDADFYR